MKINLESLLKALGWPIGLTAVFAAVLALFGVELNLVLTIAGVMLGGQALIGLLVDVLKFTGVVQDGTAGVWSAGFHLIGLGAIAYGLYANPAFDFPALDAQLLVVYQFASLIFGFIVQVVGSKRVHQALVNGLGLRVFTRSFA
ncbi:MAG: hypothetical protein LC138_07000 [Anaerolineales bacterium]|nr:hypothetical protein [Anaerolineales bacterium]